MSKDIVKQYKQAVAALQLEKASLQKVTNKCVEELVERPADVVCSSRAPNTRSGLCSGTGELPEASRSPDRADSEHREQRGGVRSWVVL